MNTVLICVVVCETECFPFRVRENHLCTHLTGKQFLLIQTRIQSPTHVSLLIAHCHFLYIESETNRRFPEVGPVREIEFSPRCPLG